MAAGFEADGEAEDEIMSVMEIEEGGGSCSM